MALLQTSGSNWSRRFLIAVDGSASASTADRDVELTIPEELEDFWDNVDSSGHQVRFTRADGVTLVEHRRHSWTYASRVAVFHVLGEGSASTSWGPPIANAVSALWCYVGLSGASDTSSATVGATMFTGYLSAERPLDVIPWAPEQPGATKPRTRRSKTVNERAAYWLDVTDALRPAQKPYGVSPLYEELYYANITSEQAGGATALEVETATRFAFVEGRTYLRFVVSGGTDGLDYTIKVVFAVCSPDESPSRIHEFRLLLQVKNPDDAG